MPYIGDVLIEVIEDINFSESSATTDHALEDGEQITDHVEGKPITFSIKGVIKDDTESKVLKLRKYRESGEILNFDYMTQLKNVVITDFGRNYNKDIKDGYSFSMSLKQIKIAKVASVVTVKLPVVKRQTKVVTNAGRKQVKKTASSKTKEVKKKYTSVSESNKSLGAADLEGRK